MHSSPFRWFLVLQFVSRLEWIDSVIHVWVTRNSEHTIGSIVLLQCCGMQQRQTFGSKILAWKMHKNCIVIDHRHDTPPQGSAYWITVVYLHWNWHMVCRGQQVDTKWDSTTAQSRANYLRITTSVAKSYQILTDSLHSYAALSWTYLTQRTPGYIAPHHLHHAF